MVLFKIMPLKQNLAIISDTIVINKIYEVRGHKVMLDSDLAELYGVETRILNQAIRETLIDFRKILCFSC